MRFVSLEVRRLDSGHIKGVDVLHDIDLEVAEHEVVTVLGSNGAGKSTLLMTVAGLLKPSAGDVFFGGENITGLSAHEISSRGLVLAPSGRRLFPDHTVEENLLLGAYRFRKETSRVNRMLDDIYDRFPEITKRRKDLARTFSGGEQQIISIARALMAKPQLLMLDEPSMGLSPSGVAHVFQVIEQLRNEGTTILMVEKLARLASEISDRLIVLELGRVTVSGTAGELANDQRVEEAYLGKSDFKAHDPRADSRKYEV